MKTRLTELLGIRHPILLGGMQWISRAEFVAAVAETGATGFLTAATFASKEELAAEIAKTKALTRAPFGVNISLLPDANAAVQLQGFVEAILEQQIPFVETSGRCPTDIIPILKENGVKIVHKVASPKHALRAQKEGVDAIVLVGYEGGGHPGMDQVGTFVNLPATAARIDLPVVAAGGVCDGGSFAAAMALGAEGILMGTRFIATQECPVHPNIKQWILDADITDTLIIQRSIQNAFRAMATPKAYEVLGMEAMDAKLDALLPHISGQRGRQALQSGDLAAAVLTAGQCSGRIGDIPTVAELVQRLLEEYAESVGRLPR